MSRTVKKVVIAGGGSAGWITACVLAAEHAQGLEIRLIESPDIPSIGVGEGTWPSMRLTLQKIGLDESEFITRCEASFKQGTHFVDWAEKGRAQSYYHPFSLPTEYATLNLASYWLSQSVQTSFSDFVTPQTAVMASQRAPKQLATPAYAFNVNYGYHLDAGKFAVLLREHATGNLGVIHVPATINHIETGNEGDISALVLNTGERVEGDLFVDCTGQQSLLLGQHCDVKFVSVKDTLFNDAALAVQVPYSDPEQMIASTTRATAQSAGWIWDIGLQTRRGVGYVHSLAHSEPGQVEADLEAYIAQVSPETRLDELSPRLIKFNPGYREKFWVRNCVAIGLSAGFVEPLEASALALIEQSATMLSDHLPADRDIMGIVSARFNEKMSYHWQRIIEFLKLHYVLSGRDDSDYWRDCRDLSRCPDSLVNKLKLWEQQCPWHDDAPRVDELFPSASYQYVLYGMGFSPRYLADQRRSYEAQKQRADTVLQANIERSRQMLEVLPTNRELITAITRSCAG